ncbi:MAG: TrmH family RNA methyltransferase [Gemmatimonadales bacterium]|nr:TrmH family RNA methyltransferase [Gemmatimonadales bacterium]
MSEGSRTAEAIAAGPVLVLVEPQDLVNIASCVRLCRNFGIPELRLVQPWEFDAYRIEGIAHNTAEFIARIRMFDTLPEAIADCAWSAVLTGRERAAKRTVLRPREAAAELTARAAEGRVAIVAGREDKGLTNEEIDHCNVLVTIATDPSHSSLNLAQAVNVLAYESWVARGGERVARKAPRRPAGPATGELHERLFADWRRLLDAIDFFKTRKEEHVMRSMRELLFRADLDEREAKLLRAISFEVRHYVRRRTGEPFDVERDPDLSGAHRPETPGYDPDTTGQSPGTG